MAQPGCLPRARAAATRALPLYQGCVHTDVFAASVFLGLSPEPTDLVRDTLPSWAGSAGSQILPF